MAMYDDDLVAPGIRYGALPPGVKGWIDRGNSLPGENDQGHRTRYSDSSLYDEVCILCGARDYTMGTDETRLPCPSPLRPSAPVCDDPDPVVAGPEPVEARAESEDQAALERDARRWRILQNYAGLVVDDSTGYDGSGHSHGIDLRFVSIRISSLRPKYLHPVNVHASQRLTELVDCASRRAEAEGWWDPEEPVGGFTKSGDSQEPPPLGQGPV